MAEGDKQEVWMHAFYEGFYQAVETSAAYRQYCKEVFGEDFSQDGFSDISDIADILQKASIASRSTVLDMGCGNGKLCEYIYDKTGAIACGFDYSHTAIESARKRTAGKPLRFDVGLLGEMDYGDRQFDAVLSIDTMYFTDAAEKVVSDAMRWLKPGGMFIIMYGAAEAFEGVVTHGETAMARAIHAEGFAYEVVDYTHNHYLLMRRKRSAAMRHKAWFEAENLRLHERIMMESIDLDVTFAEYAKHFGRFMYIVRK